MNTYKKTISIDVCVYARARFNVSVRASWAHACVFICVFLIICVNTHVCAY